MNPQNLTRGLTANPASALPLENRQHLFGNSRLKFRKRLKAKHLSDSFRARIVSLFLVHESCDDVADVLRGEMPGLTGKTVLEVMVLERAGKPPALAAMAFSGGLRRTA